MKERIKTVILVLLVLSALFLTLRVWIYDETLLDSPRMMWAEPLRAVLGFPPAQASPAPVRSFDALSISGWPTHIAVRSGGSFLGASYSPACEDLFLRSADLLRDAVGTARNSREVSREEWLDMLSGDCLYFAYDSPVPSELFASWIGASGFAGVGIRAGAVELDGDSVRLWYLDGSSGSIFRADTLARPLAPAFENTQAIPCRFAFELGGRFPEAAADMLVMDEHPTPPVISASAADAVTYSPPLVSLIQMSDSRYHSDTDGSRIYVDNLRTCRLSPDGYIIYQSPVQDGGQDDPEGEAEAGTAMQNIEQACRLVESTAAALGEGKWVLSEAGADRIVFGVSVHGIPVYGGAWAVVTFEDGSLTRAEIYIRRYAALDESCLLLPLRQALSLTDGEEALLGLCYPDEGERLYAQWRTEGGFGSK